MNFWTFLAIVIVAIAVKDVSVSHDKLVLEAARQGQECVSTLAGVTCKKVVETTEETVRRLIVEDAASK